MNGTLNVDTGALSNVGSNYTSIAQEVRETYTKMQNTIRQLTSNESWNTAAAKAFLEKFEQIRPEFEKDLQSLEDLGPAINSVANAYADAEQENMGRM